MARILLIEADDALARELDLALRVHDHDVIHLDSVAEALIRAIELAPDLVLVDVASVEDEASLLLDGCRYLAPQAALVVMARESPSPEWRELLQQRAVSATLIRPFRLGALIGAVQWAARATTAPSW